jgi:transcriptional regulator with XRE-family HTH domain
MNVSTGDRMRDVRMRRGFTQRDLAKAAGVSRSTVQLLERGEAGEIRTETLRKLATALQVPTTTLMLAPVAELPPEPAAEDWSAVRAVLYRPGPQPDEPPTVEGVRDAVDASLPLFASNRYTDLAAILPPLLRDAAALGRDGREVRAFLLRMTGWVLIHRGQIEAADVALRRGLDDADGPEAASLSRIQCWRLLHSGRFGEAWDTGIRLARDYEPRMSTASPAELSAWGWLHLNNSAAAARDARPGDADDAMRMAEAAAARIGTEYRPRRDFLRVFGPVTVAIKHAENFMVDDKPDRVLEMAAAIAPNASQATRNNRNRHLLDVAMSHAKVREYDEAMDVIEGLRADSPAWLRRQREAQYAMDAIVKRRVRTLTPRMCSLADAVNLPL